MPELQQCDDDVEEVEEVERKDANIDVAALEHFWLSSAHALNDQYPELSQRARK